MKDEPRFQKNQNQNHHRDKMKKEANSKKIQNQNHHRDKMKDEASQKNKNQNQISMANSWANFEEAMAFPNVQMDRHAMRQACAANT